MLTEEFQKLIIDKPYDELKSFITYADFVEIDHKKTPLNDIEDIRSVLEEQCEDSLKKVRDMRGEIPVAIHFLLQPHPDKRDTSLYAWQAWTRKL